MICDLFRGIVSTVMLGIVAGLLYCVSVLVHLVNQEAKDEREKRKRGEK